MNIVSNEDFKSYMTSKETWGVDGKNKEITLDGKKLVPAEALERAETLLRATWELLNKQNEKIYVLNLLPERVVCEYNEADGNCLMEDIDAWFGENGLESPNPDSVWNEDEDEDED